MAIYKNMDIKISDGIAKLNERFYVYQNDRGVELHLKIDLFGTTFRSNRRRLSFSNESVFVGATILKPNGSVIGRDKIEIEDNTIKFIIDKDLTDDIDEIGIYKIQFHLYDDEDGRITIPPVEFEVRQLIGIVGEDDRLEDGVVGLSRADRCIVSEDSNAIEIFTNGRYIKTIWSGGDLITAEKLNKIEDGIEYLDNKLSNILTDDYINIEMIPYNTASDTNITSVKDALDKLLYVNLSISLNSNVSTTLEKGRVIDNVSFTWSYNKKVVSQIFNNEALDVSVRIYNYNTSFSANKTFTLRANDGTNDFSKNISFSFLNGRYWGVSNKNSYNSNFINSLSKELVESKSKTFTVNCGEGQYIYYCIPSRLGNCSFKVGGFEGGFSKIDTIQFTNSSNFTESYDIYKSTNSNLGNTTVVVS